jgi:hypothetical protein
VQSFSADAGNGQLALTWTAPTLDGGTPLTTYQLRVLAGGVLQSTVPIDPTTCTAGSCGYTSTGLTNGTRYSVELSAVNAAGQSPVSRLTATPHA